MRGGFQMLKGTVIQVKNLTDAQIKSMYLIMIKYFENILESNFYNDPEVQKELILCENQVLNSHMSSFVAANKVLDIYLKRS